MSAWHRGFALRTYQCHAQEDEICHHWSLVSLDDPETRFALPHWVGQAIELLVCVFITEHDGWQKKIQKREAVGKELTPKQQEQYAAWQSRQEPRMVFSKDRQRRMTEAKQIKRDKSCVVVQLHLSDSPEDLQLTASDGVRYRLALFKGTRASSGDTLPEALELITGCSKWWFQQARDKTYFVWRQGIHTVIYIYIHKCVWKRGNIRNMLSMSSALLCGHIFNSSL